MINPLKQYEKRESTERNHNRKINHAGERVCIPFSGVVLFLRRDRVVTIFTGLKIRKRGFLDRFSDRIKS